MLKAVAEIDQSAKLLLDAVGDPADLTVLRSWGNRGDDLIYAGIRNLLREYPYREHDVRRLKQAPAGRTAIITGGGAWCRPFHLIAELLPEIEAKYSRVIVFPSSFDTEEPTVRDALSRTGAVVFARERESYEQIRHMCDARLAHDTAFFFDFAPYKSGFHQGVLDAFRQDQETKGVPVPEGNRDISRECESLDEWLWTISRHDLIRTDRAHVTIAAAMLGRRVEWRSSAYHKLAGIVSYSISSSIATFVAEGNRGGEIPQDPQGIHPASGRPAGAVAGPAGEPAEPENSATVDSRPGPVPPFPGLPVVMLGMDRRDTAELAAVLRSSVAGRDAALDAGPYPPAAFEDQEIVALHQTMLQNAPGNPAGSDGGAGFPSERNTELTERAIQVLTRLARPGLWGWMDPRTIHFIEFWLGLLPHAKIVIPLRHPLEFLDSHTRYAARVGRVVDVAQLLLDYATGHGRMLRVIRARPDASLVVYMPNALAGPGRLDTILARFLALPPGGGAQDPGLAGEESHPLHISAEAANVFRFLYPEAAAAFDALNEHAALPFAAEPAAVDLRDYWASLDAAARQGASISRESWTPLLLDSCREGAPGYFALQTGTLAHTLEIEGRVLSQAAVIRDLTEARDFAQAQAETHLNELRKYQALAREQTAWTWQFKRVGDWLRRKLPGS